MAIRKSRGLEISGTSVDFTLKDLEDFVHDARDLHLPVNAGIFITHDEADRPGESTRYTMRVDGQPARPQPDRLDP